MNWIDAKERLPADPESYSKRLRYFAFSKDGALIAWYHGYKGIWSHDDGERVEVLFWMPIPTQEEEK